MNAFIGAIRANRQYLAALATYFFAYFSLTQFVLLLVLIHQTAYSSTLLATHRSAVVWTLVLMARAHATVHFRKTLSTHCHSPIGTVFSLYRWLGW